MSETRTYDAGDLLQAACQKHAIDLGVLVAETALWANPEVHRRLVAENGTGAFFPDLRRARVGAGEVRGTIVDGIKLDDNGGANQAIKKAIGLKPEAVRGFESCHLWPGTAYDARFHTSIANLTLLPRALVGLSDHEPGILALLQFRSYELYGWHPDGTPEPTRPAAYPGCWREPEPFTPEIALSLARRFANATHPPVATPATPAPDGGQPDYPVGMQMALSMPPDERREVIQNIRLWAGKPHLKVAPDHRPRRARRGHPAAPPNGPDDRGEDRLGQRLRGRRKPAHFEWQRLRPRVHRSGRPDRPAPRRPRRDPPALMVLTATVSRSPFESWT